MKKLVLTSVLSILSVAAFATGGSDIGSVGIDEQSRDFSKAMEMQIESLVKENKEVSGVVRVIAGNKKLSCSIAKSKTTYRFAKADETGETITLFTSQVPCKNASGLKVMIKVEGQAFGPSELGNNMDMQIVPSSYSLGLN